MLWNKAVNYRLDISAAKADIDDFFAERQYGPNIRVFDGNITQLMSINCEAGIEAFDLDSTHYFMYNDEYMDPEDPYFGTYFRTGITPNFSYGPLPIDLKLDFNGAKIRLCLNYRLGDYSQVVPFYLWNKKGPGFGPYGDGSDTQGWDRTAIAAMPLQRIFSISGATMPTTGYTTNYLMPGEGEEYILKPMTIDHPTFSVTGNTESVPDMLEMFQGVS